MREMSSFNRLFPPPPDYCHGWKSTFLHPTIGSLYPMLRTRVLLRRRQVLMVCQSLNRYSWRASHREVRTERVPQDVDARLRCPICLDGLSANRRRVDPDYDKTSEGQSDERMGHLRSYGLESGGI